MSAWLGKTKEWFPDLHHRTYFIPPIHFNRVTYGEHDVAQAVRVRVQEPMRQLSDVRENEAEQRVQHTLFRLLRDSQQPMVLISNLDFDNYLNFPRAAAPGKRSARLPETAQLSATGRQGWRGESAATGRQGWRIQSAAHSAVHGMDNSMFARPRDMERELQRGRFDILVINKNFGFVICEIKTVGDLLSSSFVSRADEQNVIRKKMRRALVQLDKEEAVLRHLVSDLGVTQPIRKVLILPNLKRAALREVLKQDVELQRVSANRARDGVAWYTQLPCAVLLDSIYMESFGLASTVLREEISLLLNSKR